jgi:hypothetical protein
LIQLSTVLSLSQRPSSYPTAPYKSKPVPGKSNASMALQVFAASFLTVAYLVSLLRDDRM